MENTRRFELKDGASNKFWEVWVDGDSMHTRFGKIGSDGQTSEKAAGSPEAAQKLAEKMVKEKTGKGYVEVGGSPSQAPAPQPVGKSKPAAPSKAASDFATRDEAHAFLKTIHFVAHRESVDQLNDEEMIRFAQFVKETDASNLMVVVSKDGRVTSLQAQCGKTITVALAGLSAVEKLNLGGVYLKAPPEEAFALPALTHVTIHNCLHTLPDAWLDRPNLVELSMSRCALTLAEDLSVNWPKLEVLKLPANKISALPRAIYALPSLTTLELDDNPILKLGDDWSKLRRLKRFAMSRGKLKEVPEGIGAATALEALVLVENALTALPESLGALTNLKELWLGKNKLKSLPASLSKLTGLEVLMAGANQLKALPDLKPLKALRKLSVKSNKLTSFDSSLKIAELHIGDNPMEGAAPGESAAALQAKVSDTPYAVYTKCLSQLDRLEGAARDAYLAVAQAAVKSILSDIDEHGNANIDQYGNKTGAFWKKEAQRLSK